MRLQIITPLAVVVDDNAVTAIRAEDASGSFGVLPGHAKFLTSLALSVVSWKGADGRTQYCAVRGGLLSVTAGSDVAVATREAITGDDLATLDATVLARFHAEIEQDRAERFDSSQLQINAIRRIVSQLQPSGSGGSLFS